MLFRLFVGMNLDEPVWDVTVFTKNRNRLLEGDVAKKGPPDDPGNPTVDFHGEQRSNQTHQSTTDPDALLARKGYGKEAKLSYNGNLLTENRKRVFLVAVPPLLSSLRWLGRPHLGPARNPLLLRTAPDLRLHPPPPALRSNS